MMDKIKLNRIEKNTIKIVRKLTRFFYTNFYRVRYSWYMKIGRGSTIDSGFIVKQFTDKDGKIFIELNGNNRVGRNVLVQGSGLFSLGANSYMGDGCVIGVNDEICIGKDVMIAHYTTIRDTDHNFDCLEVPMNKQGITSSRISIGDNVWIGHGVVILKGISIGSGSIIAAGSVVNSDVPTDSIYGGIPARLLKKRCRND